MMSEFIMVMFLPGVQHTFWQTVRTRVVSCTLLPEAFCTGCLSLRSEQLQQLSKDQGGKGLQSQGQLHGQSPGRHYYFCSQYHCCAQAIGRACQCPTAFAWSNPPLCIVGRLLCPSLTSTSLLPLLSAFSLLSLEPYPPGLPVGTTGCQHSWEGTNSPAVGPPSFHFLS